MKFDNLQNRESLIIKNGRAHEVFNDLKIKIDSKILDIGCGSGLFLDKVNCLGFKNLYGVDIDKEHKESFFYYESKNISFERLPWPDDFFDVITSWQVFEHLENPNFAVAEINRVLKKDGLFIISLPNVFHLISRLIFLKSGDFPRWNKNNNHISVYPQGIFEKIFLKNFRLLATKYFYPEFPLFVLGINKFDFLWKYLPENRFFSHFIIYIMRKK